VKKTKQILSLLLIFILAVGMTLLSGCSQKDKTGSSDSIVLTINDTDIYMSEMMYYIMAVEATGAQYDATYQQLTGTSYWDQKDPTDPDGKTFREQAKDYIMDSAQMYEILYEEAVKEGYTLTDDEKTEAGTNADQILNSISDEQLKVTGFTKESLTTVQQKLTLASKYYNDLLDTFDIDEDSIKETINRDDYKKYKTEYLFVASTKYDENYNSIELTDEEKANAKKTISAALKKAKKGQDFSKIQEADKKLTYNTLDFIPDDGTAEKAYQAAAIELKNDAISDIVETDTGYYIIKMLDNDSSDAYDEAVDNAISQAKQDAFNAKYENIKKEYTITIHNEVWDPIVIGNITILDSDTSDSDTSADTDTTDTSKDNTTDNTTDTTSDTTSDTTTEENTTTGN
jgi:foldase protein PrsA